MHAGHGLQNGRSAMIAVAFALALGLRAVMPPLRKSGRQVLSRAAAYAMTLCAMVCTLGGAPVRAGLVAAATRVIYSQDTGEQSLILANANAHPVIVQTWVDGGQADPNVLAPFVSLPSVFQLPPKARGGIRILLADARDLAQDRESVFWLNLHEIPPTLNRSASASDAAPRNRLALAMNTQLKIFYRPANLPPVDVATQLRFALVHDAGMWFVQCDNPTPYHASFTTLEVGRGDASEDAMLVAGEMDMMTAPFSRRRYALGDRAPAGQTLRYALVDDAGFAQRFEATLSL